MADSLIIRTSNDAVKTHMDQKFWAVDGMIRMVDERDGNVQDITIRDFGERAIALAQAAAKLDEPFERARLKRLVVNMRDVLLVAVAQGDLTDPAVAAQKRRSRRRRPGAADPGVPAYPAFNDASPTFVAPSQRARKRGGR